MFWGVLASFVTRLLCHCFGRKYVEFIVFCLILFRRSVPTSLTLLSYSLSLLHSHPFGLLPLSVACHLPRACHESRYSCNPAARLEASSTTHISAVNPWFSATPLVIREHREQRTGAIVVSMPLASPSVFRAARSQTLLERAHG